MQWINDAAAPYTRYLELSRHVCRLTGCICQDGFVQVAVDAKWAFDDLPLELAQIWADSIANGLDDKSNVKSESLGSHSYTKFDKGDPFVIYSDVIAAFAGPNGRAYNSVRTA
ncbi:hypothetical protein DVS77_21575 [Mycolicibacterium moriokaense]|nr:hypothetical protein DVS77_21575 [Mycolicibacterium moriokaense]